MTSTELERLAANGHLKREPPARPEIDGLIRSGTARLDDAENAQVSLESRFDLAYNAAHALSLAALRRLGYRAERRYLVFQVLPHTLGLPPTVWRILAKGHDRRNQSEYGGTFGLDKPFVDELIGAARQVLHALLEVDGARSDPDPPRYRAR